MHISEGILSAPVLLTTGAACLAATGIGLARLDYERVPRVGMLASAFFIATLISVPVGVVGVHLLLNGLLGLLLGWAAFPAILAALFLQAILFGHGALTTLGANTISMALPAVICYYTLSHRIASATTSRQVFRLGFVSGVLAMLLSLIIISIFLLLSGKEYRVAVALVASFHLPLALVEGFVTGAATSFLYKTRPELLKAPMNSLRQKDTP